VRYHPINRYSLLIVVEGDSDNNNDNDDMLVLRLVIIQLVLKLKKHLILDGADNSDFEDNSNIDPYFFFYFV
jgi:hypothetical protein